MKPGMPHRARVFCVNWGHAAPVARHIVCVYDKHDRLFADAHFATFGEAIAYVDKLREAFAPVTRADFTRRA